jgi:WD40 repeat protein
MPAFWEEISKIFTRQLLWPDREAEFIARVQPYQDKGSPEQQVALAFFLKHRPEPDTGHGPFAFPDTALFWLPVDLKNGKGQVLPFAIQVTDRNYPIDQPTLELPGNMHPLREQREGIHIFLKALVPKGTWVLHAPPIALAVSEGESWRLPLYYAVRAACLGLRTRLDIAFTGCIEAEGILREVSSLPEKSKAAQDMGLSALFTPSGGGVPLLDGVVTVSSLGEVDSLFSDSMSPLDLLGERNNHRAQWESDSRALKALTESNTWPDEEALACRRPAEHLPWPFLRMRNRPIQFEDRLLDVDWQGCSIEMANRISTEKNKGTPSRHFLKAGEEVQDLALGVYFVLRTALDDGCPVLFEDQGLWPAHKENPLHVGLGFPKKGEEGLFIAASDSSAPDQYTVHKAEQSQESGQKVLTLGKAKERHRIEALEGAIPPSARAGIRTFVGREWLTDEVEAWIRKSDSPKAMFLSAPAGWGKTFYAAQLADRFSEIAGFYFCETAQDNPDVLVDHLAHQIASRLGIPKTDLTESTHLERRFKSSVLDQLEKLKAPRILLFDSLDRTPKIAQFLGTLWRGLPPGFKMLATGRSMPETFKGCHERTLDLEDRCNEDDVAMFIRQAFEHNDILNTIPLGADAFRQAIVGKARGLFIYAHYALEGIRQGTFKGADDLPEGIEGIYATWFNELFPEKSTFGRFFKPILGLISTGRGPSLSCLKAWLGSGISEKAVRDRLYILKPFLAWDKGDGPIEIYHSSLSDWLNVSNEFGIDREYSLKRIAKSCMKLDWAKLFIEMRDETKIDRDAKNDLAHFALKNLPGCLLQVGREEDINAAAKVLTDFDFQMLRCGITGEGAQANIEDFAELVGRSRENGWLQNDNLLDLSTWHDFFRACIHILRRGDEKWPAYKILLQLAVEHMDDSPITESIGGKLGRIKGKKGWLDRNPCPCNWVWLRNPVRACPKSTPYPTITYEGHADTIQGIISLSDEFLLSWTIGEARLWNLNTGEPLDKINALFMKCWPGKESTFLAADHSPSGHFSLWKAVGGKLRLLEVANENDIRVQCEDISDWNSWQCHKEAIAWAGDNFDEIRNEEYLQAIDQKTKKEIENYCMSIWHWPVLEGMAKLVGERIVFWTRKEFTIWDLHNHEVEASFPRKFTTWTSPKVVSQKVLLDYASTGSRNEVGLLVSYHLDTPPAISRPTVRSLFQEKSCQNLHDSGALLLNVRTLLAVSPEGCMQLQDIRTGELGPHYAHESPVNGVIPISRRRVLSWSDDCSARVWDYYGTCRREIFHDRPVIGGRQLSDGRIVTWDQRGVISLWDDRGKSKPKLMHHSLAKEGSRISWVAEMKGKYLVSFSNKDGRVCLWDGNGLAVAETLESEVNLVNYLRCRCGFTLSWSRPQMIQFIESESPWLWEIPSENRLPEREYWNYQASEWLCGVGSLEIYDKGLLVRGSNHRSYVFRSGHLCHFIGTRGMPHGRVYTKAWTQGVMIFSQGKWKIPKQAELAFEEGIILDQEEKLMEDRGREEQFREFYGGAIDMTVKVEDRISREIAGAETLWQGAERTWMISIHKEGIVVVRNGQGNIIPLLLHHGNKRVVFPPPDCCLL